MTNPVIDEDGNRIWYAGGKWHREDGPAVIWADGSKEWWVNGKCHRTDGPAYIDSDGTREWCVNGTHITSNKEFQKAANLTDEEMLVIILKYGDCKSII